MEKVGRQYIVVLSVYHYSVERLAEIGPPLMKALQGLSTEAVEMAFRSEGRDILAYLVRSKLAAGQIRAAIESPGRYKPGETIEGGFLTSEDQLLIVELGEDKAASRGLSRALTWLQRH